MKKRSTGSQARDITLKTILAKRPPDKDASANKNAGGLEALKKKEGTMLVNFQLGWLTLTSSTL